MLKNYLIAAIACLLLLLPSRPGMAMLKVLEPAVSEELRGLAVEHLVEAHNVERGAVTVENSWVREFWNIKTEVYMVEAVINKGLPNEQKAEVPVRVDQKVVLSPEEFKALVLEEESARPDEGEPQARILTAQDLAAQESAPVLPDVMPERQGSNINTVYYTASLALLALAGMALVFRRRRA